NIKLHQLQLELIEHYLKISLVPLRSNFLDLWNYRLSCYVKPTNDKYMIRRGVEQLTGLVQQLELFLEQLEDLEPPPFLLKAQELFERFNQLVRKSKQKAIGKKLTHGDINRFDNLFRRKKKELIRELLDLIYTLDCFISVAGTIDKFDFTIPEYDHSPTPQLSIYSLFHPFVDDCVKNDIQLGTASNLCFLTGPNMAGKSTFLKAIGLAVYLAHLGFPVPTSSMKTTVFNGLITTINLPDDINRGYSHYYSEVRRVKETVLKILEHKNVLVIFDELFRGTNVKDAYEASYKIIQKLVQIKDCLFFISTHINEITAEFDHQPISYHYFDSKLVADSPVYDYKLKSGISAERMGMQIIKNEKIIDLLDEVIGKQQQVSSRLHEDYSD
ncbi:MAG TPA: hypothetical protein VKA27_16775, partial [Sunxiuqinia sp.]|nr:hypothetical protein [Sunxiuqinia sp.]